MNRLPITAALAALLLSVNGSGDSLPAVRDYGFIIMDSPARLFTMRQFDACYLSGYRLGARGLYAGVKNERIADFIQVMLETFFLVPLTHEEGHRSILTARGIGAISQPYFDRNGAAYVKGVADRTLLQLRDDNLPTYIRLHTAGIESDYALTRRAEAIASFGLDDFRNYRWEYWMRKLVILQYFVSGLFRFEDNIGEEEHELDRDIVGYDTYGAARHLFRPAMEFHRYTRYDELTGEERSFVRRMGWRSLLNLLNPLMVGRENFKPGGKVAFNAGLGYTLSPFGDFIDENIWLKYRSLNCAVYAREFQSRERWFFGFGASLHDWRPVDRLSISLGGHFWRQPEALDFSTSQRFTGGAVEADAGYFLIDRRNNRMRGISVDLGMIYKTKGFLPEEVRLDEAFGVRIGTTVRM